MVNLLGVGWWLCLGYDGQLNFIHEFCFLNPSASVKFW
jgi:hypothetical protein